MSIKVIDIWEDSDNKEHQRAQKFVNVLKRRMKKIEDSLSDDWQSDKYINDVLKITFLNDCIQIICYQSSRSAEYIEALGTEHNFNIDKLIELEQTKLELIRMKQTNAFLLKMCTKLDGRRVIKRPLYILHPKYIIKPKM